MDKKQNLSICCLQEMHFRSKDTCRLKVRGWGNIYHINGYQKKAGIAILISDKLNFKPETVNIYAPNIGTAKYIKQLMTNTKERVDKILLWQ